MGGMNLQGLIMGLPPLGEAWAAGGAVPVNTAPPSISSTATIGASNVGTAGTWTGTPVLTHQWQRYVSGAWANIVGATATNYTPVDADFGYKLRLAETDSVSGTTVYSNETALTVEAPVQTLGVNLVVDGDMEAAGTSDYVGTLATLSKQSSSPHGGAQSLRVLQTGATGYARPPAASTPGILYEFNGFFRSDGTAIPAVSEDPYILLLSGTNATTWTQTKALYRATGTGLRLYASSTSTIGLYSEYDDISQKAVNSNTQLAAPSANMRITQLFTLPASPAAGSQLWLLPRIADFANGNYWLALLEYTGTQWNANLYSVASHTRTSRASASNIGATNGIRVNANGNSLILETTANDGGAWTQRGVTVNNSSHNTATGVNVLATSDFVLGALQYEDAV